MSPAAAGAVYFKAEWPTAADPESWRLARKVLHEGGKLTEADGSFIRAAAAIALERTLTMAESGRLLLIAMRAGVTA